MSRTTGRTMALLGLLQSRREWSGADLCARLEVSERTLRRDVDDLRELGYGIEATRGLHGGYRLGPGAAVPPLTLTRDEAIAIAVGLRAAALDTVVGIDEASASALAKLEQSLGASTKQQIGDITRALVPLGTPRADVDLDTVATIALAIRHAVRLRLDYTTHEGRESSRTVEPHRIVHTSHAWYLIAWDADRRDWRTLRVDRITRSAPTSERFTAREIPDGELRAYTSRSITTAPYRFQARLRVHASAIELAHAFGPDTMQIQDNGDGTSTVITGAHSPEEIALYVGVSGFHFEIIDGDELRHAVDQLIARLHAAARGTPSPG